MAEIKPLTVEQLKERIGKPVYWPNDLIHGNLWGIVDFDESFPDDIWFCNCHNGVQTTLNIKMRDMELYDTETLSVQNNESKVNDLIDYVIKRLDEMQAELYGGEDRPSDYADCGMIDGEYNTLIKVLDLLGINHDYVLQ